MGKQEYVRYRDYMRHCGRLFLMESRIECHSKTKDIPFDQSGEFHNHNGYEVLLLLGGEINLYTGYGGIHMKPGDFVCIPAYEFHRVELLTKEQYDRIVINIMDTELQTKCTGQTNLEECFLRPAGTQLNVVHLPEEEIVSLCGWATELEKVLGGGNLLGGDVMADAYFKLIMVAVNRNMSKRELIKYPRKMPEIVKDTINYVDEHLTEEITLKVLEDYLYHNGTYISRCFRNTTGISLQQYIIERKIMMACRLLREGHSPSDVCYETGFGNYSNFSRTFSKKIGVSPKKYQLNKDFSLIFGQ